MRAILAISLAALLTACETTTSFPYQPSIQNVVALQSATAGATVQLGEFTVQEGINGRPNCRLAGPIDPSPGKPLGQYIRDAFQAELFQAGAFSGTTGPAISVRVIDLDLNTIGTGHWRIVLAVNSDVDQDGYVVVTTHEFSSSFSGNAACSNAAQAFGPAVSAAIGKVIAHSGFGRLIGKP